MSVAVPFRTTLGGGGAPEPRPAAAPSGHADDDILTSREACALLRISRTTLHELTRRLAIPAYRVGTGRTSGLRYRRGDLLGWLYSRKVQGGGSDEHNGS
jgi:excisionase family DNA binding protein